MEPAIKNWRNFPPPGGWALQYELEGQKFSFSGAPKKIVDQIRRVQEANGIYRDDTSIWNYTNSIWCERAPKLCIRSMLNGSSRAAATGGPKAQRGSTSGRSCGGCGGGRTR